MKSNTPPIRHDSGGRRRRGLAASSASQAATAASPSPSLLRFLTIFYGAATAAYQIEGAANEDGRTPSVARDTFSHTAGKTFHGETGDVADDSYHLYKQDIQLMKNLGVTVYRFSISWSRVFPDAVGKANQKGLDYYQRVVDELLKNGIAPYVTLFHWDLPQVLPGGWQSRGTSQAFAEYAGYAASTSQIASSTSLRPTNLSASQT